MIAKVQSSVAYLGGAKKMKKAILAKKVGMTQVFTEDGKLIPVTVMEAGPCSVLQIKSNDVDGYESLKVSFGDMKENKVTKPVKGQYDASKVKPARFIREFRLEDISGYELGQEIKADIFAVGERVDISGTSKGKGFQGNIKRHGHHRGPMSHGSKYHRGVGGLAGASDPSRVRKGRKLPGHMGDETVTVQNLEVVRVDADKNLLLIKGAVPGIKGALLFIKDSVKVQ